MIENITARARSIDTAEAAKMLRPHLRAVFPGVKFSVRIDRYSMGSSIHVDWTDGPTSGDVSAISAGFDGSRFEGMTDCSYSADSWYCEKHGARTAATYGCDMAENNGPAQSRCCAEAELVHFSVTHLSTTRTLSEEFRAELAAVVRAECGMPADGRMDDALPENSIYSRGNWETVGNGVYRLGVITARPVSP